ncbi:hypothetical protein KKF84_05565 [Myxococcota bacterium]|nr:hypothetical protein [Myxococcota bacterium]MBU1534766.1 hypothetical protein [Myxococcota bacterium]
MLIIPPEILTSLNNPGFSSKIELTDSGFYCYRDYLRTGGFCAARDFLLTRGDVLIFDFNMGMADSRGNYHDGSGFNTHYEGFTGSNGNRVFHVDHHYPFSDLNRTSTTPMVHTWLLGLHKSNKTGLLERISRAQYLANHEDQDIAFSIHLAQRATDREYLESVGSWLASAALINDHIADIKDSRAQDAFYGGLAIEQMVKSFREPSLVAPYGRAGFHDALHRWIPALATWLRQENSEGDCAVVAQIAREEKIRLAQKVERFSRWEAMGLLHETHGILWMSPPESTENAYFYRYLQETHPGRGRLLLLCNPVGGGVKYKIRSLGDFPLTDLFSKLNEALGETHGVSFGGRYSAGGSTVVDPPCTEAILEVATAFLQSQP